MAQVQPAALMELRDSIFASGQDLHRPVNLASRMRRFNQDQDVNKSLMTMLLNNTEVAGQVGPPTDLV